MPVLSLSVYLGAGTGVDCAGALVQIVRAPCIRTRGVETCGSSLGRRLAMYRADTSALAMPRNQLLTDGL
jgi:hypothetical protein